MAFSRNAFSQDEREKLKEKIRELEEEIRKLKENKEPEESNNLEDMLC